MRNLSPIVHPGLERFDEVVETLCDAFRDYPVMRFVLGDAGTLFRPDSA